MSRSNEIIVEYTPKDNYVLDNAVIKFGANWCGPCKRTDPIYERIANKYHQNGSSISFYKVNIDKFENFNVKIKGKHHNTELIAREVSKISSIPYVIIVCDGAIKHRIKGWNADELTSIIESMASVENQEIYNTDSGGEIDSE